MTVVLHSCVKKAVIRKLSNRDSGGAHGDNKSGHYTLDAPEKGDRMPVLASEPCWSAVKQAAYDVICDYLFGELHKLNEPEIFEGLLRLVPAHPLYRYEIVEIIEQLSSEAQELHDDDPLDVTTTSPERSGEGWVRPLDCWQHQRDCSQATDSPFLFFC